MKFISLIAQTRGFDLEIIHPELPPISTVDHIELPYVPLTEVTLTGSRLKLSGLWPIILYFLERYPEPELLPVDCVHRAVTRSLANTILMDGHLDHQFGQVKTRGAFILSPHAPSLLDVAFVAVTEHDDPKWGALHRNFARFLEHTRKELEQINEGG